MSSFLAVSVSTERSQHTCAIGLSKQTIGGEIVDRDRNHEPFDSRGAAALAQGRSFEDVVGQDRLLGISASAEEPASRGEGLGNFGDDSRRAENRELRAERGEQVTAMTLSTMIGMDGDLVDEGT